MKDRGQIVPLVAFLLVGLLGMSALAIDMGFYRYQQRLQQSATDAAAIAAASELAYSQSNASAAAYDAANTNGFATPAATVSVNTNYSDSFTTGASGAVQVSITKSYPRFFGAIYSSGTQGITTTAVASLSNNATADCMYLLSKTSPGWSFAGVTVNAASCGLAMNCAPSTAGGDITALSVTYSTCTPSTSGNPFTINGVADASPTLSGTLQDPCPYITACNYITNNPPSTSSCPNTVNQAGGSLTLMPGCYSSFSCAGCNITLTPSSTQLYIFNTSVSCAGCTITGDGVTIYAASGSFSLAGVNYNLSPPTSGNYEGVTFYQPSSNSSSPSFAGGSGSNLSGLFYAPAATLSVAGSFDQYAQFVANTISTAGGSLSLTGPPTGANSVATPSLVE
jgi:Putative Flp pilus-assembly TadE/G-like